MAIEMKVPSVGESVTEVTIATWVKKDGDTVKMDEIICELESDKATFELPSEASGTLRIVANEGETLEIGALICNIEEGEAKTEAKVEKPKESPSEKSNDKKEEPVPSPSGEVENVLIPSVGESITEVTVSQWMKKTGDTVKMDEIICELESDKATFELPSPKAGVLTILEEEGAVVEIDAKIATISVGASSNSEVKKEVSKSSEEPAAKPANSSDSYAANHPSPAAAKILQEKGIDPNNVDGTGVAGRIIKEDAQNATRVSDISVNPREPEHQKADAKPVSGSTVSTNSDERRSRREKMSGLRKTIARRLVAVKNETAMLTTFNEVDMKPIMDIRKAYKDKFKETHGVGLGFMSFFTKACAIALQEFPTINSYIDGDEIIFNDFIDISIAVSAPKGLVVPVIRDVQKLDFAGIESEVIRLAFKARDNKLTIPEMTGGTFTITNGGIFGSMLSTPIINAPQSAILGMHNIVERPVAINGQVEIRPIMYVALSYDHRTIDGKQSVGFLVRLKQLLEDPMRMLLSV
jgi:2-oxoglutarate dehydrogenase E2 component (dihydrolipoamide succinyltransferase)